MAPGDGALAPRGGLKNPQISLFSTACLVEIPTHCTYRAVIPTRFDSSYLPANGGEIMWPFHKKRKSRVGPEPNTFYAKDSRTFFQMQCEFGQLDLRKNQANVALVLDARDILGERDAVRVSDAGCQVAVLRVADQDGGFITVSQTPSRNGDPLEPGDLVLWVPLEQTDGNPSGDPRLNWVGLIRAKIPPEYNFKKGVGKPICRYD